MKDTIESMVKAGKKAPPEIIREAKRVASAARKNPEAYDPECPPSSPQALAEFAAMARSLLRFAHIIAKNRLQGSFLPCKLRKHARLSWFSWLF
jgi:hypothetical protein